ncbi:MAG: hypothetical protein A2746_02290, partial [Candidatus Yanofskybacteria bacterium RIFCSPHIGHO2_01_FULL_44_22]
MVHNINFKNQAINLRRKGLSYSEILRKIPVAKSTLSSWLQSVGLSRKIKHILTEKKRLAALRGAASRKTQRIELTAKIQEQAIKDIKEISIKELWLMGIMLYWAEGSKEKEGKPGSGVQFCNSDAYMIRLFIKWLTEICLIDKKMIGFDLFIHENHKHRINNVLNYWVKQTSFPLKEFNHIYYKKNKISTNRKNIG